MMPIRSRASDGLDTHRTAIAALGLAVARARVSEAPQGVRFAGPAAVRVTDAPKTPSRRRSRGQGALRAVAPDATPVVPLAELTARRAAQASLARRA